MLKKMLRVKSRELQEGMEKIARSWRACEVNTTETFHPANMYVCYSEQTGLHLLLHEIRTEDIMVSMVGRIK